MHDADLPDVAFEEIEAIRDGPAGPAYLEELHDLQPFVGPYAVLDPETRTRVDAAVLAIVDAMDVQVRIALKTSAVVATGIRA